jgi:hypothetical protein
MHKAADWLVHIQDALALACIPVASVSGAGLIGAIPVKPSN